MQHTPEVLPEGESEDADLGITNFDFDHAMVEINIYLVEIVYDTKYTV